VAVNAPVRSTPGILPKGLFDGPGLTRLRDGTCHQTGESDDAWSPVRPDHRADLTRHDTDTRLCLLDACLKALSLLRRTKVKNGDAVERADFGVDAAESVQRAAIGSDSFNRFDDAGGNLHDRLELQR